MGDFRRYQIKRLGGRRQIEHIQDMAWYDTRPFPGFHVQSDIGQVIGFDLRGRPATGGSEGSIDYAPILHVG